LAIDDTAAKGYVNILKMILESSRSQEITIKTLREALNVTFNHKQKECTKVLKDYINSHYQLFTNSVSSQAPIPLIQNVA
jgi:hypothetical protein